MDLSLSVFLILMATTAVAATVNGAIGYGFSSIIVPVSLTMISGRVLNPALVVLEVVLNSYSLWLHRRSVPAVWPRVRPVIIGLLPGVVLGSLLFGILSTQVLKATTYLFLLPMVALQSFAIRWTIRSEKRWGVPFGGGLGVLYATTTVSGPPLALYFTNLGLVQDEFRAALATVRVIESTGTLIMYSLVGAITLTGFSLAGSFLPVVLLGLWLGRRLVVRIDRELFARLCMRVDAVLVTIGLAVTISVAGWLPSQGAWLFAVSFSLALHLWAALKARRVAQSQVAAPVSPEVAA